MFTTENTTGYDAAALAALNAELDAILAQIDPEDTDALIAAEHAFADAVARR